MKLLHVGCARRYFEGFINSDIEDTVRGEKIKLDLKMDLTKPFPYEDSSIDGIIGMAVHQQIAWRDLVNSFRETLRVLKPGGVFRIGVPMIENNRPLEHLLGWNNTQVFDFHVLQYALSRVGFKTVRLCNFRETAMPEFAKIDNREDHMFYVESIK